MWLSGAKRPFLRAKVMDIRSFCELTKYTALLAHKKVKKGSYKLYDDQNTRRPWFGGNLFADLGAVRCRSGLRFCHGPRPGPRWPAVDSCQSADGPVIPDRALHDCQGAGLDSSAPQASCRGARA